VTTAPSTRRFWGAGPRIVTLTVVAAVALAELERRVPGLRFGRRPPVARALGQLLLVASLVVWFLVIGQVRRAYARGQMLTTGIFAYVRNPIYADFIFLTCPAVVLVAWAWPMLALPFVAYGFYRLFIGGEEARLAQEFGAPYAAYRERVPALLPRLRR
jgi:protein-S-isoprenylcysteine O-methyltransferase Ste14